MAQPLSPPQTASLLEPCASSSAAISACITSALAAYLTTYTCTHPAHLPFTLPPLHTHTFLPSFCY